MPEPNPKRTILLASVLKPVDEPRMYERMGHSLSAGGYEVFIVGFPPSDTKPKEGIHFLPHKIFNRISVSRIRVRFEILRKVFSMKPDFLVICTHELIGVALLYRLFSGKRIIYDVQENYFRNILYTNAWPKFIRPFLAFAVRLKEIVASPFFSRFFLAEKCFQEELAFAKGKAEVIENKCRLPQQFQRKPSDSLINLIFTGTIAESTGIFQVIDLSKKLHEVDNRIRLSIIGYSPRSKIFKQVKDEISAHSFISLAGGDRVVPHMQIMEAIASAHFGILFYPTSKHTENRVPSKLYEYLACGLPILLQSNKLWVELCKPYSAAIEIDFNRLDIGLILKHMSNSVFYKSQATEATWSTEEIKLINAFNLL